MTGELHENIDGTDSEQDVVTDADQEAQDKPPQFDPEDVEEAKLFGWKSPDEWQGEKPEGYIDNPEEYLGRVKRSRIFSAMQSKLDQQATTNQDMVRRLEAMSEAGLKRQRAQFDAQIERITQSQRAAVAEADTDEFDRLEKERQAAIKDFSEQSTPAAPQANPDVEAYKNSDEGAWLKNPILLDTAARLIDANPAILAQPAKAQLEYAEGEVRKMYPAYFPKKDEPKSQPKTRQVVDAGGLAGGAMPKPTAFAKLPAEAKSQFEKFVKDGIFSDSKEDREEYANEYNNS